MGQPIAYNVTLYPAEPSHYGTVSILITNPVSRKAITASSIDELLPKVEEFANEYGFGCEAGVSVPRGTRKPRGFDARLQRLFYNLDKQPDKTTA